MELSVGYNPNWLYNWHHNNVDLGITSNKLFSIGKNTHGDYKVIISNNCDTVTMSINIRKTKGKKVCYLGDVKIGECPNDGIYDDEWYQKLESELEFIIFPNPTKEFINLRIYRGKSEYYLVNIYDQMGKVVLEKKITREDQINVSTLSGGIYSFEVVGDNTRKREVLVLQ